MIKYCPGNRILSSFGMVILVRPETRRTFWEEKIGANKTRDKKNQALLAEAGWKVLLVWQCELKNKSLREKTLDELQKEITST